MSQPDKKSMSADFNQSNIDDTQLESETTDDQVETDFEIDLGDDAQNEIAPNPNVNESDQLPGEFERAKQVQKEIDWKQRQAELQRQRDIAKFD